MLKLTLCSLKSVATNTSGSRRPYNLGAVRVSGPKHLDCVDVVSKSVQLVGGQIERFGLLPSGSVRHSCAGLSGGPDLGSSASCVILAVGLNRVETWARDLSKVVKRLRKNDCDVVKDFQCCV